MTIGEPDGLETFGLDFGHGHMVRRVPLAGPEEPAEVIRRALLGTRFDSASDVAVCEDGRLVGLIRIEDLLAAGADQPAREIMDPEPPVVAPGTNREKAAWQAVRHGEGSLAVVDAAGKFVGLVPPPHLLTILLQEHDEDLARLGGFLHDAKSAREASEEPVLRRYWHRMPWLLVGLAGAVLASAIVGSFEAELEANVMLAFFIPGIVYMADAVGTQTETLVIRGLSVGVPIRHVLRREAITGLLVGLSIALVFYPLALLNWGEPDVALAVSLSLLAACSVAAAVAMVLPWLIERFGMDPAFGSGPLATVIQDLLSILVYFGIALALV